MTNIAHKRKADSGSGMTLLVTLLVMSVLLSISASLLNISLKQYRLSGIARDSEMAFQAASAAMECAVFNDVQTTPSPFSVNVDGTPVDEVGEGSRLLEPLNCMGDSSNDIEETNDGEVVSREEQLFRFQWNAAGPGNDVCSEISVYKFSEMGASTDVIEMATQMGVPPNPRTKCRATTDIDSPIVCTVIRTRGYNVPCNRLNDPRAIERELVQRY